ncbi:ATP-binding cassette domain-containing protein [candidate division WOR-3 bacterium]|jgi:phospholipid/cholesterol/gamma-HCH transport system ATP-binding protein|nr:ATP-binding cassette domain-containing protein [candidate division WOR-3 bacterium]
MIEVKNVSKKFDSLIVLDNVSFNVGDARLIVILGPSGTGKTVLLKAILGLMSVDSGEVLFDGKSIQAIDESEIYEIRKNIGFVFQGTALFDSMNVLDNIALPIVEHTSASTSEVKDKVTQILEIIGMSGKEKLYPRSLSGGMKRLVAVGRALALDPKYLFYDEPTTGLDPIMRDRVVKLIIDLKKNHAKSGIVVTHDLDTAKAVGDEIYMLKRGKISKLKQIRKEVYNG